MINQTVASKNFAPKVDDSDEFMFRMLAQPLGQAIRRRRQGLCMTQQQLADKAECHRTFISDLERGQLNITIGSLNRLARGLNTSAWFLLRLAEEHPEQAA